MEGKKRGRLDNSNGGPKRPRPEMDSLPTGVGSKLKPCTKFFSTAGCQFGESCHFLHYVPGGYNAVAQMMNLGPAVPPPSRNMRAPAQPIPIPSTQPAVKSRLCNKYNTAEGCKFGDKCNFAHGEWELGKSVAQSHDDPRAFGHMTGRIGRMDPVAPPRFPAASFGSSATAKVSVDASLVGAVIGKGGFHSKHIFQQTGAKLTVRDHESDPSLRNIELEGTIDQVQQASAMLTDLIARIGSNHPRQGGGLPGGGQARGGSNYKTKLCENFEKGSCTFAERCHFAHGAAELRKTGL